ncbi:MFS transporter [Arcanobacterium ihumii]|uniref:MFS transporter n=1 Tax=Arcanobacterium ihumii TaxID=2138162 RepID=UPI000F52F9E5|nr:MFS transporter [Arcanobacterium ihumii]
MALEPAEHGFSSYQKKALGAAAGGLGLQSMSTMLLSFVLASMIVDFGINKAAGGFISTITNLGMLAGGILFGTMADRFGHAKNLAVTVAIFSVATACIGFATGITAVYVLRFFVGVGGGGMYGVVMSIAADAFEAKRRGRITSWVTISGQLGAIIAAIAAAIIVPSAGWRGLFFFGGIPILFAVWAWFALPESDRWKAARAEVNTNSSEKISIGELFREGRASVTLRLMLMATVQVAGYFGLMNWLPSIIQQQAKVSFAGSSIWMISTIIGMVLGMLVFGQFMDKIGPKFAYGSFLLASAVAVFLYSFASSSITILIGGAIVGFFANGMNAGYGAIVGNLYPTRIRATANNIIFNIGRAVGGFSSVAIGFFLDNYSLLTAMGFLAALYILSFLTVMSLNVQKGAGEGVEEA